MISSHSLPSLKAELEFMMSRKMVERPKTSQMTGARVVSVHFRTPFSEGKGIEPAVRKARLIGGVSAASA